MNDTNITNEDEWLSTSQAAEIINASSVSVARWCDQGMVNHFRTLGGHRRILRSEAESIRADGLRPTQRGAYTDCGGDNPNCYGDCNGCRDRLDAEMERKGMQG